MKIKKLEQFDDQLRGQLWVQFRGQLWEQLWDQLYFQLSEELETNYED
jgi:hypothetical protein